MADDRLRNLEGKSRRNFLRWTTAVGAALALDRAKILDVIADSAGVAMADSAACATTNRSVHLVAGDGGLAWFQLLWPQTDVATANNASFAFHEPGQAKKMADTDKPLYVSSQAPWQTLGKAKRVTAMMAGVPVAHTAIPTSSAQVGGGQSMLAVCAAIQRATPSLLPVIGITPLSFGSAPGAPEIATVGSAEGMVQLFNSAASQTTLAVEHDAQLFEAYYKAFTGMNAASTRPTRARSFRTGKTASSFLAQNLAALLRPTEEDLARYGIVQGTRSVLRDIAEALITTVKAFRLGLTQMVVIPAMRDDPHQAFANMGSLLTTVATLGKMLDAFMSDLDQSKDPLCSSRSLGDNVVITVHGDTPKTPFNRVGWPDGTPGNSNWMYAMGNGHLKTGWFGGLGLNSSVRGFDPTTGNDVPGQASVVTSAPAGAAVAFAVAKGDMKRVADFYNGPSIAGIVHESVL